MSKFAIRPRRYWDQLDAIEDKILNHIEKGHVIDRGLNPNSVYSLLAYAHEEILRLRAKCGEAKPERKTKLLPGPRPAATSSKVEVRNE